MSATIVFFSKGINGASHCIDISSDGSSGVRIKDKQVISHKSSEEKKQNCDKYNDEQIVKPINKRILLSVQLLENIIKFTHISPK